MNCVLFSKRGSCSVLENNKFTYTPDEGVYEGSGMHSKELFEGYYRGLVDGEFRMWRQIVKQKTNRVSMKE